LFSGKNRSGQQALDESERAVLDAADSIRGKKYGKNSSRVNGGNNDFDNDNLDLDAITALEEFSFLEKSGLNETIIPINQPSTRQTNNEEWNVDPKQIQKMTEIYKYI
jgi:hypothetical protein